MSPAGPPPSTAVGFLGPAPFEDEGARNRRVLSGVSVMEDRRSAGTGVRSLAGARVAPVGSYYYQVPGDF